jgi:C1A family cysteine protease
MKKSVIGRTYGWRKDKLDKRDFKYRATRKVAAIGLPSKVDLRPGCPPVYDQGQISDCVGNGVAAGHQFEQIKQDMSSSTGAIDFIPSRLFIYYGARELEGTTDSDSGAEIRDGIKTAVKQGVCPETMWPHDPRMVTEKPTDGCYQNALTHQVLQYLSVDQTLDEMRSCLAEGYPIIMGFTVYESFENDEVARSGIVNMPEVGEEPVGGHAICAVGYDDTTRRFLVRNSWGSGWGQKGYFTIPYEYFLDLQLASDLWTIRFVEVPADPTPVPDPVPMPEPVPEPVPEPEPDPGKFKLAPSLDCTYWRMWTQFIGAVNTELDKGQSLNAAVIAGCQKVGEKTRAVNDALAKIAIDSK